jgi:protein-S-isoprenylcysteine O-methyltransferase Ste14
MPLDHLTRLALLGLAWVAYFSFHSLLASLGVKRRVASRWPALMPVYRLVFNGLAVVLLLPVLWLHLTYPGSFLWRWQGGWFWLANGLAAAAALGFLWSFRYYDMGEFLGLRQWRNHTKSVEDQEHLRISPLHRFVRHPWYFFALVIIWTRDMNGAQLLSSILVSLYLLVGSRLEERKLLVYHGDAYRRYRERVPALFPLPWRYLSKSEAERLAPRAR